MRKWLALPAEGRETQSEGPFGLACLARDGRYAVRRMWRA
jgi:hypothetical protein